MDGFGLSVFSDIDPFVRWLLAGSPFVLHHIHTYTPRAQMHTKHDLEKVVVQFDVQDTTEDELNPEELECVKRRSGDDRNDDNEWKRSAWVDT